MVAGESLKPDFSGTWRFNAEKSRLQIPPPDSSTFHIEQKESDFFLTRTHVYQGKADTFSIRLTTDGKEVAQEMSGRTVRVRLNWEGSDLIFDSILAVSGREASNVVRYHLSEDGKTFIATERFRGPELKYDNVWVFDRE